MVCPQRDSSVLKGTMTLLDRVCLQEPEKEDTHLFPLLITVDPGLSKQVESVGDEKTDVVVSQGERWHPYSPCVTLNLSKTSLRLPLASLARMPSPISSS